MLMTAAVPLAKNVLLLFEVITLSSRCRNTEKCGPGPGSKSSDKTDPGSLKKTGPCVKAHCIGYRLITDKFNAAYFKCDSSVL